MNATFRIGFILFSVESNIISPTKFPRYRAWAERLKWCFNYPLGRCDAARHHRRESCWCWYVRESEVVNEGQWQRQVCVSDRHIVTQLLVVSETGCPGGKIGGEIVLCKVLQWCSDIPSNIIEVVLIFLVWNSPNRFQSISYVCVVKSEVLKQKIFP